MFDYSSIYRSFISGRMTPFYTSVYPELLRYAARILGPELGYLAEDCVQDAVMNTYLNRSAISDVAHWRSYIIQCVRSRALNLLRHQAVSDGYAADSAARDEHQEDVSHEMIRQQTLDTLFAAIDSLPEVYREIFELSFEQGLKNPEIARMLDVAEITVKKRKAKLIELLRRKLGGSRDDILMLLLQLSMLENINGGG